MNEIEIGILEQILEDLHIIESEALDREADWRLGSAIRLVSLLKRAKEVKE